MRLRPAARYTFLENGRRAATNAYLYNAKLSIYSHACHSCASFARLTSVCASAFAMRSHLRSNADAGPLTILGDQPTVLSTLQAKGIAVAQNVAHVTTPTLMVTAHGTSKRTLARTRAMGLTRSKPPVGHSRGRAKALDAAAQAF